MRTSVISILRWLAVIPAYLLADIILRFVIRIGWDRIDGDLVDLLAAYDGFSGRWLRGPMFVIMSTMACAGFAVYAAVYTAPSAKRIVRGVVVVASVALMLLVYGVPLLRSLSNGSPVDVPVRHAMALVSGIAGSLFVLKAPIDTMEGGSTVS